jgi:hypothetical protein
VVNTLTELSVGLSVQYTAAHPLAARHYACNATAGESAMMDFSLRAAPRYSEVRRSAPIHSRKLISDSLALPPNSWSQTGRTKHMLSFVQSPCFSLEPDTR